MGAEHCGVKAI